MKSYEFVAATTEAEVVALLSSAPGRAEVLAGGTDLVPLLAKSIVQPDRVVYIGDVASMREIRRDEATGGVAIGAGVHLDDLAAHPYLAQYPAILHAIRGINSLQLQAQGTLGGELCRRPTCWYFRAGHGLLADGGRRVAEGDNRYHAILGNQGPAKYVHASRIAPAVLALGGRLRLLKSADNGIDGVGEDALREDIVSAGAFYHTPTRDGERETILADGQCLTHLILPPAAPTSATYEVRQGEGPEMPLAAAAAALDMAGDVVRAARIVLGQVAPVPWPSSEAADVLVGRRLTRELAREAGWAAVSAATPLSENEYKVQLAAVAVERAILAAAGRETGGF